MLVPPENSTQSKIVAVCMGMKEKFKGIGHQSIGGNSCTAAIRLALKIMGYPHVPLAKSVRLTEIPT
jgi:hypothetical protein